ncbi:MAG: SIS domain-containing protein [Terrimicrobiaceae bacterium]
MTNHIENLIRRQPALAANIPDVSAAFEMMRQAFLSGRKLLLCGNGGSAADAEHWAGELLKGFVDPRPLPPAVRVGLPDDLAGKLQWALPAIPLTGFPSLATAFANDVDPDFVFAQLAWGLGNGGDVLVAISTSGNSANVCHAARAARAKDIRVLAMTGETGGRLRELADVCIAVPATETYLVQEFHLPVYHCLCLMLEEALRPASGSLK